MNDSPSDIGAVLLRRLLDRRPEERAAVIVERLVDHAAERLGALDRDRRRRPRPAFVFAAGFLAGLGVAAAAALRSPVSRRVMARLREDASLHAERVTGYDDAELAHKVESVVFRDQGLPKGKVSVNAEAGTVFLRGQVDSADLIVRIDRAVRAVEGVAAVENLLHLPGTPAPHAKGGALLAH